MAKGAAKLPLRDDLPAVGVSRLRALGVIRLDMTEVEISFGDGPDALKRTVGVAHRLFPARGPEGKRGSWSFFVAPCCGRRARTLRLYDGRVVCRYCDGLLNRAQMHDKSGRIERLRQLLDQRPRLKLTGRLERALKRALIVERRRRLGLG